MAFRVTSATLSAHNDELQGEYDRGIEVARGLLARREVARLTCSSSYGSRAERW